MGLVFYDYFSMINVSFMHLNFNLGTIYKSRVYKMEAIPIIIVYYCLDT